MQIASVKCGASAVHPLILPHAHALFRCSSAAGCTALLVPLQQPQTDARAAVQQVEPLLLPLLVTAVVSDNGASVAMSVGGVARWPCSGLHQPAAGLG